MPLIGSMKTSNYLKKEDVGAGTLVTISRIAEENIAKEGEQEDLKWNIYFHEFVKPLISNDTNRQMIAYYLGSEETDDWINKQIILWNDPSVTFGAIRGGIRVRQANQGAPAQPAPPTQQQPPQQPQQNQQQVNPADPNGLFDDIPW